MIIKNAMMLCISCKDWSFPKHVLIKSDGKDGERLDDIAKRAFESYRESHNDIDLDLIHYTYYGNVEIENDGLDKKLDEMINTVEDWKKWTDNLSTDVVIKMLRSYKND